MTVGNLLQTLKPDASLGVVQDFSQDILNYQKHSNFENNVYLETQNAELWFRRLKLLSSLEDDDFAYSLRLHKNIDIKPPMLL